MTTDKADKLVRELREYADQRLAYSDQLEASYKAGEISEARYQEMMDAATQEALDKLAAVLSALNISGQLSEEAEEAIFSVFLGLQATRVWGEEID